ncbi:MAG: F0F1 ATP synthase subunit delta [Actinobacteria bacterium]|nr:MAG: F0F1 ATP synthase subunit delta [Actinomycetota bacterium]
MRNSGEAALNAATHTLDVTLAQPGVDVIRVAEDFFGLSDLVRSDIRLRRALTDPARSTDDKQAFVKTAVGEAVAPATVEVLNTLVASHWSNPMDLHDACEVLGIISTLEDARRHKALETVGKELFAVADFLGKNRDLRMRLSDMAPGTGHERGDIASHLFEEKISQWAMRLLRRGVARTSHGRLLLTLRRFAERAAHMQQRQLVSVEAAAPLTAKHIKRLKAILSKRLGSDVIITVSIVPELIGGFRIKAGTTALDSTIQTQVSDLRRTLVGSR